MILCWTYTYKKKKKDNVVTHVKKCQTNSTEFIIFSIHRRVGMPEAAMCMDCFTTLLKIKEILTTFIEKYMCFGKFCE